MDAFARALVVADKILQNSPYRSLRAERYASFQSTTGQAFENANLTLEELTQVAIQNGEPQITSGRQELFENIINQYI